ncbi:2OG-Fe(II) oxygenase [Azospirillum sp. HJ39]|uniref:2OG-Fe(II) oxygenase n=1 Tax=Azospirillum sp. HJ39 TaxID=3159496 RepID=UPI0035587B61
MGPLDWSRRSVPSTLRGKRASEGLGVAWPVLANLYKLPVYAEGDFFAGHRDTEKMAGMFATLVIAMPSLSSGGELAVTHKGRPVRLDLCPGDPAEVAFAAFYADCLHEVRPVTAGHRLVLIYNLVRSGSGCPPRPPDYAPETGRVASLFEGWATGEGTPRKLVYPLEHAYTQAELGFAALKGADAAVAGCDLHLALQSIDEHGAAEYAGTYRGRWDEPDEDAFEAGEVFERVASLSDWRRPDGTPLPLEAIPVEGDDELSPPGVLEDAAPDEESFQEVRKDGPTGGIVESHRSVRSTTIA